VVVPPIPSNCYAASKPRCSSIDALPLQVGMTSRRLERSCNSPDTKHNGLAIKHEFLSPNFMIALDNPRIPIGPIMAIQGKQPHPDHGRERLSEVCPP
jgi:hypothetical protein